MVYETRLNATERDELTHLAFLGYTLIELGVMFQITAKQAAKIITETIED